jgi:hypothetical protein
MMVRIGLKEGYKVFAVVLAFAGFELAANAKRETIRQAELFQACSGVNTPILQYKDATHAETD